VRYRAFKKKRERSHSKNKIVSSLNTDMPLISKFVCFD
jgi:hypothetical protein